MKYQIFYKKHDLVIKTSLKCKKEEITIIQEELLFKSILTKSTKKWIFIFLTNFFNFSNQKYFFLDFLDFFFIFIQV